MSQDEVQHRALRGVALVGARSIGIRVIGIGSTVVLAHLLTPRDFGIIAIGMAVVGLTQFADAGIAAGLIRGQRQPERADLASMAGLQLSVTTLLAILIASVSINFGTAGRYVALVSVALPISVAREPAFVVLERQLAYRPMVMVETLEWVVYYGCGIPLVVLGAGIWGMGVATIARLAVGSAVMLRIAPAGRVWPRFNWARVRPYLHFGVRFQGILLAEATRDQGVSFGILWIANATTLGLWSLVTKIMQVPLLLQYSLRRVSYPAMARLMARDMDAGRLLERGARAVAVTSGLVLTGLVATGPALVPVIFGTPWLPAVPLLPWVGLALAVGVPIMVVGEGYLFAYGDVSSVFRAVMTDAVICLAITFAVLPVIGIRAIGIGLLVGRLVGSAMLGSALRRAVGTKLMGAVLPAVVMTTVASAAGWTVARALGPRFTTILASGALAGIIYLIGEVLLDRRGVSDTLRFARRSVRRDLATE